MSWIIPECNTYCPKCGQLEAILPRHNSCLDCLLYDLSLVAPENNRIPDPSQKNNTDKNADSTNSKN